MTGLYLDEDAPGDAVPVRESSPVSEWRINNTYKLLMGSVHTFHLRIQSVGLNG